MLNLKEENKVIQEKIKTMDFSEMQEHLFASVDKENHKVYIDFINDYMNKSQILVDILNENQINSVGKILKENNIDYEVENKNIKVGSTILDEQDLDNLIYSKDLVERFDLELPDFTIYNNESGEMLYNSETREKAKDLEQFIVDKKGEEFWNNMALSKPKNWESLINDNSVTILSNETNKTYDDYSKFVFEEMDKEEFSSKTYEENIVQLENVRIDLVENSKDNKISKENYEKIKEKYIETDYNEKENGTNEVEKSSKEIEM